MQTSGIATQNTYRKQEIKPAYGNNNHCANNFGKFGVPRPVTGSHPFTALNPFVPHPGFVPFVMSLNALRNLSE